MNSPSFFKSRVELRRPTVPALRSLARDILVERELRNWSLPHEVFDEVAWEMLLDLYACETDVTIDNLIAGKNVTRAAADRWIAFLIDQGLVRRSGALCEAIELTSKADRVIGSYLESVHQQRRERYCLDAEPAPSTTAFLISLALSALAGSRLTFMSIFAPRIAIAIGAGLAFLVVAATLFRR